MAIDTYQGIPENDSFIFRRQKATRRSGISSGFLNSMADQVARLSSTTPYSPLRVELILGKLDANLSANGFQTMTVDAYDPVTDDFVAVTSNQPRVREVFGWEVSAGKRIGCIWHSQSGLLIPIAAEC